MLKKISLLIMILMYSVTLSSAAMSELAVTITPNSPSFSANHGDAVSLKFEIDNDNSVCDLSCTWVLFKDGNSELDGSLTSSAGSILTKSFTANVPTKSQIKQDFGVIEYTFKIKCSEIKTLICWTSGEDEEISTISINYDLTNEERIARDYMKSELNEIKSLLEDVESKIYNLNTKFDQLESNILVSDLKQKLSSEESVYASKKVITIILMDY